MILTAGMRRYLRHAAKADIIHAETVAVIEPSGRLPKPLFDCLEEKLIEEVRDLKNGSSCGGQALVTRLSGWRITDSGRAALAST